MDDSQKRSSIEVEQIETDPAQAEVFRRSYRVPMEAREDFFVAIAGESYLLQDISAQGVGFSIEPDNYFPVGKVLSPCDLNLGTTQIMGLGAEVIHNSFGRLDKWVCGVRWLALRPDDERKIESVLQILKKELFESLELLPEAD